MSTMLPLPHGVTPAIMATAKAIIEHRSQLPQFEVILFDREHQLYRDILNAESRFAAGDIAVDYAQRYYPECNRIHVNLVEGA